MATVTKVIKTPGDLAAWVKFLTSQDLPMTVAQTEGAKRTNPQNATIHKWFGEIAQHLGDKTAREIKAECNLMFGLDIMREDAAWASAFDYIFASLNYPAKIKAIMVFDIPFTRKMRVPQLTQYMDEMGRYWRGQGVYLTDPELQKYQGENGYE